MSFTCLKNKVVTIKKPRECLFCGKNHVPGEKMKYLAGVYDGLQSQYHCLTCDEYMNKYREYAIDEENFVYPDFVDERHYKDFAAGLPMDKWDRLDKPTELPY